MGRGGLVRSWHGSISRILKKKLRRVGSAICMIMKTYGVLIASGAGSGHGSGLGDYLLGFRELYSMKGDVGKKTGIYSS